MEEIGLWTIDMDHAKGIQVNPVESIKNTKTETDLEEILVAQPELLEKGLWLVGRQVSTTNGPLDLLGIDSKGRLVVFELKRGVLARDAVAQIIDYASDLDQMDRDDLARHLESQSGRGGIPKIEDFNESYNETFPGNNDEFAITPRMVLVGLGIDQRALRMVRFLSNNEIEIDVLTFQAFNHNDQILLARQVEVSTDSRLINKRGIGGREQRWKSLISAAKEFGVREILIDACDFVSEHCHKTGEPGKTGITFYKRDFSEDENGPGRAYVSLNLDPKVGQKLILVLTYRAVRDGGALATQFINHFEFTKGFHWLQKYEQYEIAIDNKKWREMKLEFGKVLDSVNEGIAKAEENPNSALDEYSDDICDG